MEPPPPPWRFRCYVAADGTNKIREWYDGLQDDAIKAKFLARLNALRGLPFSDWREPLFKWLEGGIGEIRFFAGSVQQRPLGFRGPGIDVFTIVFPATEKGDKFVPKDAIERAIGRKKEVESNAIRHSRPCWLFEEKGDPDRPIPQRIVRQ